MKKDTIYTFFILLLLTAIISCSGSSGKNAASLDKKEADVSSVPARRLIEVLSPADNESFTCNDRIVFSVARAAGSDKTDSVQIWVAGRRIKTLTSLPSSVEIAPSGLPGRLSLRAVAFSSSSKPHNVTLFVTLLSDINPALYRYRVVKAYPHDSRAFTQGLVWDGGFFYEGTGQPGESSLRKVDPESGKVISQLNLESSLFGEGVALLGERIYQLTWTTRVGFVYDKLTFSQVNKIYYQTQGWGLTTMGDKLIMSDGTNIIRFLDSDFNVLSSVEVWDNKAKVDNLNELEMIEGELWANIWQTDRIARIDPLTGKVTGYIDLGNLLPREDRGPGTDVLNGIAWDAANKRIFVTGKYWPKLYEITIVPQGRN
ncbi:MAG TPA: glutaminyl-peptide cyclotransferase [Bacteroidales bacterium]|nr:glutaminyl-peptide cyclotransferase [Bacteroidales bacterium]